MINSGEKGEFTQPGSEPNSEGVAPSSDSPIGVRSLPEHSSLVAFARRRLELRAQAGQDAEIEFTPKTASNSKLGGLESVLSCYSFYRAWPNEAAKMREARRMLSVYGPSFPEQTGFLKAYSDNIELFALRGLSSNSGERADLLARFYLAILPTGFEGYQRLNVEGVRTYVKSVLEELGADFSRDGNPVHAWEAFRLVTLYSIRRPPRWILNYLARSADEITKIWKAVSAGKSVGREAEQVGKALGFGNAGPGQGGWFKHATILERDRSIYCKIEEKRAAGAKLDFAYDEVSKAMNMTRSMVQRGYARMVEVITKAAKSTPA